MFVCGVEVLLVRGAALHEPPPPEPDPPPRPPTGCEVVACGALGAVGCCGVGVSGPPRPPTGLQTVVELGVLFTVALKLNDEKLLAEPLLLTPGLVAVASAGHELWRSE